MRMKRLFLEISDSMGDRPEDFNPFVSQETDSALVAKIKRNLCHDILDNRLTKTQKCYIMLYYVQDKSMVEIAQMYNVNKSTVSRTIKKAREKILSCLSAL